MARAYLSTGLVNDTDFRDCQQVHPEFGIFTPPHPRPPRRWHR